MRMWKRCLVIFMVGVLLIGSMNEINPKTGKGLALAAVSNKTRTISIRTFIRKVEKAVGIEKGTLIEKVEFENEEEPITWRQAVVIINYADEIKNGVKYDEERYNQIIENKRLTGLKGLGKLEKKAARLCFAKGIITGDSKGNYTQSRAFRADDKVTVSETHKILVRLKDSTKRVELSPDGQLLRKTNLPANYKKYDYILAAFPNEFYERKFYYEMATYYYEPVNLINFACPKDIKKKETSSPYVESGLFEELYREYGKEWIETIYNNLECRFNFDYRTVDDKWLNQLAATYIYDDDAGRNKRIIDFIGSYIETAKENHVVIKADRIVVEPSTMYYAKAEYYVRCYVKFKILADEIYPAKEGRLNRQHELIFSGANCVYLEDLQKNKWYEISIDVPVRQTAGNQNPASYTIGSDQIWPWE